MTNIDDLTTEHTSPEILTSLFAWFTAMRATEPVSPDKTTPGVWHVFRYADVSRVLSDPGTFSSDMSALIPSMPGMEWITKSNIVGMDAPLHRKLRGLVSKAFTPKFVTALTPRITELTAQLLDAVKGSGRIELVGDLSHPLPVIVVAEVIGVPIADRPHFQRWAEAFILANGGSENALPTEAEVIGFATTASEMYAYMLEHIAKVRANPGSDLISELVAIDVDGERLDDDEISGFVALLLLAGHITTTAVLGNTVLCLDENRDALAELRRDPGLIPAAVEEVVRLRPAFSRLARITTREVELGGVTIPPGQMVTLWAASANRDEQQFPDPERFDIHRTPNRHLGFGHGIHFCLGAPLARLETRIALEHLLDRYADFTVSRDEPVEFHHPHNMIGARKMYLDVTPS